VPELARDEDHVEPLGDQERGKSVAQRVQREPTLPVQGRRLDGRAERLARVAVVAALPEAPSPCPLPQGGEGEPLLSLNSGSL
jgi:hypothetical protein